MWQWVEAGRKGPRWRSGSPPAPVLGGERAEARRCRAPCPRQAGPRKQVAGGAPRPVRTPHPCGLRRGAEAGGSIGGSPGALHRRGPTFRVAWRPQLDRIYDDSLPSHEGSCGLRGEGAVGP